MKETIKHVQTSSLEQVVSIIKKQIKEKKYLSVVTANPEIIMKAHNDSELSQFLKNENTYVTADGIGIVKAYKHYFGEEIDRVTGVDIVENILQNSTESIDLFVYGATESVLNDFEKVIKRKYKNFNIVRLMNGYDYSFQDVLDAMSLSNFDLALIALGVPKQETFMLQASKQLKQGVLIGCGGTVDVISGNVTRAPKFFVKLNIEWLYRIFGDKKRMKRFYNNQIVFLKNVLKDRPEKK